MAPATRRTRPRGRVAAVAGAIRRRALVALFGAVVLTGCVGAAAWAYWTEGGDGEAIALTGTFEAPGNVVADAPVNSATVAVTWHAAALATGEPATGYLVVRVRDRDGQTVPACGTSLASPTAGLSCEDLDVVDGNYHYRVTGLIGSWTADSANSPSVEVINDNSPPTVAATDFSPARNGNGWISSSPVVVTLTAHAGFGVASISYALDGGPTTTVNAASTTVSVSGDADHSLQFSATDLHGAVSATETELVRIDTVAPSAPSAPDLTAASDSGSSSSDRITNVTTPTVTGTAEPGSTVSIFDGRALVGSALTTEAGVYSVVTSTLDAGVHVLRATATDPAGNSSRTSAETDVTIDTAAPVTPPAPVLTAASDSGISSSDQITNVTTPTFTGSAEADATITLFNTSTAVGTATASGTGSYDVTSSTLTDGVKTITITATDVAGNVSANSASVLVTIDTVAPAKTGTPVLSAASDSGRSSSDKITSVTTPTITGTTTAVTTVYLYTGTTLIGSGYAASTAFSVSSSTLPDASHVITTRAADTAGNLSIISTSITVVVDTIAPPAASAPLLVAGTSDTGRSATDRITNKTTPVVTGTNESKAIVTLFDADTQVGQVTTTSTSYSVASSLLGSGTHTLSVTSVDVAGNEGPSSATTTIFIDTTPPEVPSDPALAAASDTGISSSDRITKSTVLTFTGTGEEVAYVRLYDGAVATGTTPGPTVVGGTYSGATSTLSAGTHTITAKATDVAGNVSASSGSTVVVIDLTVPTATLNVAAGQADPTTTPLVDYTLTFSERVFGLVAPDITYSGTAGANTAVISGDGPYDVSVSGMTKTGTVTALLTATKVTDAAGNANSAATSTNATVTYNDVVAPAAPSAPVLTAGTDTGFSNSDGITNNTKPTFTGTAAVGSTVKIYNGTTQIASVVVPASGIYSIANTTALANGTFTITATATDASLNVSPASSGTTVTIDTIVPTVTLNQAASQADPTTSSPITFTVAFNSPVYGFTGTGLTLTGTAAPTSFAITGAGPYAVDVSGMTKTGTVIPALAASSARDLAGNLASAATYTDRTVTYTDNVAPSVSISGLVAGPGQTATTNGVAGVGPGDNLTVTVVLCTTNVFPCTAPNTKATLTGVAVNASTGAWSVTSAGLGTTPTLYARASQTDLTGNVGNSAIGGPIDIP